MILGCAAHELSDLGRDALTFPSLGVLSHLNEGNDAYSGRGFPDGSAGKESACNARDPSQEIPVRSLVWEDPLEKE